MTAAPPSKNNVMKVVTSAFQEEFCIAFTASHLQRFPSKNPMVILGASISLLPLVTYKSGANQGNRTHIDAEIRCQDRPYWRKNGDTKGKAPCFCRQIFHNRISSLLALLISLYRRKAQKGNIYFVGCYNQMVMIGEFDVKPKPYTVTFLKYVSPSHSGASRSAACPRPPSHSPPSRRSLSPLADRWAMVSVTSSKRAFAFSYRSTKPL